MGGYICNRWRNIDGAVDGTIDCTVLEEMTIYSWDSVVQGDQQSSPIPIQLLSLID